MVHQFEVADPWQRTPQEAFILLPIELQRESALDSWGEPVRCNPVTAWDGIGWKAESLECITH